MRRNDKAHPGSLFNNRRGAFPFKPNQDDLFRQFPLADTGKHGKHIGQAGVMIKTRRLGRIEYLQLIKEDDFSGLAETGDRIDKDHPAALFQQGQEIQSGQTAFNEPYAGRQRLHRLQPVIDQEAGRIFGDKAVADADYGRIH